MDATPHPDPIRTCRTVAWASLTMGALSGLMLGLWSFDGPLPEWLGGYGELSRRLARLGHIAFFGLGFTHLLLASELPRIAPARRDWIARAMCLGNLGLPLVLFAAAAWHPVKFVLPVPALAVTAALVGTAHGVWKS